VASRTPGIKHLKPSRRYPKGGWEVRYRDAGNMTRRKTFEAKQDAVAFKEAVNTDRRRGDLPDLRLAQRPFEEVAEAWYAEASKRLRPKTLAGYRYTLDSYLLPALGHRPIGKITPLVLRQVLAELPDHLSPTTKRNIFRALSPVFKQAVADGMIRSNPTPHVKLPRANRRSMPVLTAEQVEALANEVGPRYSTLVRFAAYTGLRAGEIAALRVGRFDRHAGRLEVAESVQEIHGALVYGPPKTYARRRVDLPEELAGELARYIDGRASDPDALIFNAPGGGPLRHHNFYK
jgi:integrase